MSETAAAPRPEDTDPEGPDHLVDVVKRVAPLELFFDLVFVFAITQVTRLMAENPTWTGLGQGMLVLSAMWWAWGGYAWLTNYIDPEQDRERLLILTAMAAMLAAGLALPGAFGRTSVIFGCAYALVRWLHIFLFAEANQDVNAALAIRRLARTALPGPTLLIVAGFLDGSAQVTLWIVALAIDFAGPYVYGVRGFRVSAAHFAERYGLIVLIALGESIVAIGAGDTQGLDAGVIVAASLALVVAAALWWAYFDVVALVAEHRFRTTVGHQRALLARDAYSYLHLPMIAGIVLLALGFKKTIAHVHEPLDTVPAVALFGGIALYYAGHLAFRLRNMGSISRPRTLAALVCVGLIPVATQVDAVVALALAAGLTSALIAYEAIHYAEARQATRSALK
jgi:low temperature requirement protein LtrA